MTCEHWYEDEDCKHGGSCDVFDRDCSGTRDNGCCDIVVIDDFADVCDIWKTE